MDNNKDLLFPLQVVNQPNGDQQQTSWEEYKRQKEQIKQNRFKQLAGLTLLYAVIYTFCMYDNLAGITMPLWIISTILYCCQVLKRFGISQKKDGIFHMIVMVLLGISTVFTGNPYIIAMNYLGFFLLLLSFLFHTIHDDREWGIGTYFLKTIYSIFGATAKLTTPLTDAASFKRLRSKNSNQNSFYILIGLMMAIPCSIFLGSILSSADVVFHKLIVHTFSCLRFSSNWFGVVVLFTFAFLSAYCGISELLEHSHIDHTAFRMSQKITSVIAIGFMSPITLLYALFSIVQIIYLFFGFGTLPSGITYSEYARTGFFQLLFVCVLNFLVVLFVQNCVEENRILRGILLAICCSTFIMIASSAYRMLLYIGACQLTFLRIFVLTALAIIAFLMAGVVVSLFKNQFPIYKYSLIVVSTIYLGFSFSHVDYFIASYNLNHAQATSLTQTLDYIHTLSSDAAPAIADYLDKNEALKENVTSYYKNKNLWSGERIFDLNPEVTWYLWYMKKIDLTTTASSPRKFNFSYYYAKNALS